MNRHSLFKKISSLFLLLFISKTVFCQKNFVEGYLITNDGDTSKAIIDYRNWIINPEKLVARSIADGSEHTYSPEEIRGFGTKNDHYVSAITEVEVNPENNPGKLDFQPELKTKQEFIFLQTIVQGPKSLYLYSESTSFPNFYIFQDSTYKLLRYKEYLIDKEGLLVIAKNQTFISQLFGYFGDSQIPVSDLGSAEYNLKSLKAFFLDYYKSKGTYAEFELIKKKRRLNLVYCQVCL